MLKSIGFRDLVILLSNSRRSDRVYLWLICMRLGWEALQDASFKVISKHSLRLWFYWLCYQHWVPDLPKCWDSSVSPGCGIRLFFCSLSTLFQHVDLVATSLRAGFQAYVSQPWALCMQAKATRYNLLGVESLSWALCFFLVCHLGGWNQ